MQETREYIIHDLSEMKSLASSIISDFKGIKIMALEGNLGSGKTAFVKGFAACLGITEPVSSPTFSLVHEYGSQQDKIFHFDLYRVKSEAELYQIGFEEYLEQHAWVLIEWPEKARDFLPLKYLSLQFDTLNKNSRRIVCKIVNNG